jgi:hypothetical protein
MVLLNLNKGGYRDAAETCSLADCAQSLILFPQQPFSFFKKQKALRPISRSFSDARSHLHDMNLCTHSPEKAE